MTAEKHFSRDRLRQLLVLLNEQLKRNGVTGELCLVGGAAMILAFGNRNSTKDIDTLVFAPSNVRTAAAQVAESEGLPPGWLNDGAKGFASARETEASELMMLSHLRVLVPTPEYILAMKCMAARAGLDAADRDDAKFLICHLGLKSAESVLEIVEKYYPKDRIPAKAQYFVQEICDELFPSA